MTENESVKCNDRIRPESANLRYYRLRAHNSRSVGRRPSNPYTTGRPTSRAIQRYIGLLVYDRWVVSYASITAISPCLGLPCSTWGTPYIQNQPSGHMGLGVSSHYPPRAPLYSHTGLRPLCCELCSDNGHFPPVWAYQAGLIIYMHMPHIQKRTGRGINGRGVGAPTSPACP